MHEYPDAGHNAPPEVQEAIARFHSLPPESKERLPLLYFLLGAGTPPYKMSKEDAQYAEQTPVPGQTCDNCEFAYKKVVRDQFICSKMRGDIAPKAWCKLWYEGKNSS